VFVVLISSLIISIFVVSVSILYSNLSKDLPSLEALPLILEPQNDQLPQPSQLYDRRGEQIIAILENANSQGRKFLPFQDSESTQIPESLISATITAVDPSYWTNPGVTVTNFQNDTQPTIAQRLIRENLLWDQPSSLRRSIIERILAVQLISEYGREQILEWYINSANYGHHAYGADAAARVYLGKPGTKLSLAEAAILVAAAASPSLNPIDAPIAALEAKDRILQLMYEEGRISANQLETALDEELTFQPAAGFSFDVAPEFTRSVVEQASAFVPPERIFRGGFNIITSLDYELQTQVECTISTQIERISNGISEKGASQSLDECEMARLLPTLKQGTGLAEGSVHANVIVTDPHNGQVLVMTGENDPGHPPGSILTPFIYLTSFSRGTSPGTMVWDIPASLVEGFSDIQNPDGQFHGPVSMRTAMVNDYLVPALQTLSQMNPDQVWHTVQQLGLNDLQIPEDDGSYLLPIQGGAVDLIEISQAYGALASQGSLSGISQGSDNSLSPDPPIDPQFVLKVEDEFGNEWLDCTAQLSECRVTNRPVITPQLAYLVTHILSDETARWPSLGHPNPLEIGRPAAAKIGRTIHNEDSWAVGYTPDLVTAVWLGLEDSNQESEDAPNWAAGLWHAVIQYASRQQPVGEFSPPPGISEIQVCDPSGMLPTDECPHTVDEVFASGNEPTQSDNLFQSFLINRETGRLATMFTSPALVDQEIFMVVPPQAEDWAEAANIPMVPETYDVLDIEPTKSSFAQITSPAMFSTIRGSVPIIGRATGNGFNFYRLQFGSGLNPQSWLQIGDDAHKPVQNGQLGTWDTSGLNGLFVLQMIVAYEDETVESATLQVTVDNRKPELNILYPQDGQEFSLSDNDTITLLADVRDDLELASVEYFIDGESVAKLNSPPFAYPWKIKIGEHTVRLRAADRAGNFSEDRVRILVGQ
jgi:membrane carboxypeptidase/penicillin-binding protein